MGNANDGNLRSRAAWFGRASATVTAWLAAMLCIPAVVIGVFFLAKKRSELTEDVTGYPLSHPRERVPACSLEREAGVAVGKWKCMFTLDYTVEGRDYQKMFNVLGKENFGRKKEVTVYYDPQDPTQVALEKEPNNVSLGVGLIVGGILVAVLAWGIRRLVYKYEGFAAFSGAQTALRAIMPGKK